jgi:hypothetical protein
MQIYAPGQPGFEAEVLPHTSDLPVFSPEWLQFFQESVPVVGRDAEIAALNAFLQADAPFLWWGVYGPAGIGKSRLAYELLRLHPAWEGGFLATDRSTVGAASAWQPAGDALWIVDYAASRGEAISKMLCVLARRFAQSPTKVRVLLLERDAGAQAGWWHSLMQQSGHQSTLLRRSLRGDPLELPPLGDNAPRVLVAWLEAGGQTADEAHRVAAGITREALALATADGRPLLLGLVAAGMLRGTFDPSRRAMPDNCLDDYLSRELRHMADQNTPRDFYQVCLTLFSATLEGGKPSLSALRGRTPEPPYAEQLMAQQRALNTLASRGISERSDWALRPDALGERFIEVMGIRTPTVVQRYAALPAYDAGALGIAVWLGIHTPGGLSTLARMPDASVRALLALSLQQEGTMRFLLITLKSLANIRGASLSADYAGLLRAEYFGPRYIPQVEAFVQAGFAYAAGTVPLALLQACLDPERDASLSVWLVPFIASITALDGPKLHRLCIWYAELYPGTEIHRVRELVLAAKLLEQVALGLIAVFKGEDAEQVLLLLWAGDGGSLGDALCKAIKKLYESIDQRAPAAIAAAEEADAEELAQAMSLASGQLSFVLLTGGTQPAQHMDRRLWLTTAEGIAQRGLGWAQRAQSVRGHALCLRNLLAAASGLNPLDEKLWEARWAQMRQYAQQEARQEWTELATDALRIAALAGLIEPACRVVDEALACADRVEEAIIPLLDEGERFTTLIGRDLQAHGWAGAMRCFHAYASLLHPQVLDQHALPGAILDMVDALFQAGSARGREELAELFQVLEGMFDSAEPSSPKSMLVGSAMANIALGFLLDGAPAPFQRLCFKLVWPAPSLSAEDLRAAGFDPDDLQNMTAFVVRAASPRLADYEQDFILFAPTDQDLEVGGAAVPT